MKLSQERSRQTREQILAAARALFAVQGFEQTSIDQVAAGAKVAKASVFAHFGDKTNLLAALGLAEIEAISARSRGLAAAAIAGPLGREQIDPEPLDPEPLDKVIHRLLSPWLDYFGADPAFARLYLSQSGLGAGPFTERFLSICHELEGLVATLIRTTLPACDDARATMLSRGIQALLHEVMVYRLSGWTPDAAAARAMLGDFLTVWIAGATASVDASVSASGGTSSA
ncbi:TetR/AcrR family transcriptional regulator [Rhizobium sp. SL42]|uniref:TetR/AcrR family transcriptional regulator n=1 Tax=Rhizobium sp. SL42 TaxID=2806346 RepID=UPI001F483B7C|nr:TetR/AcrR family transcriptional regulator [Rhizobium sp. SL42]UJW73768.1 TetR/AcrR family transcriptional regulator [Rhizobium sp. SL42]